MSLRSYMLLETTDQGLAEVRIKQLTQQRALFASFRNQKSRACIAGTKSEAIYIPRCPVDHGDRQDARTQFL